MAWLLHCLLTLRLFIAFGIFGEETIYAVTPLEIWLMVR